MEKGREIWQSKPLELGSAAYVLLVPTAATIFAGSLAEWNVRWRWLLMASWVVAASLLVYDQVRRNLRSDGSFAAIDELTNETRIRLRRQAQDARDAAFEGFLTPDYWFPRKWSWTVYLFDGDTQLLAPIWPAPKTKKALGLISFSPGSGATGQAWQEQETVVRVGAEVHDETHGLNEAQQKHFEGRNSVVATPIYIDEVMIGVLAGIADDEDWYFDNQTERSHLERTATILGTLLSTLKTDD